MSDSNFPDKFCGGCGKEGARVCYKGPMLPQSIPETYFCTSCDEEFAVGKLRELPYYSENGDFRRPSIPLTPKQAAA